MDHGIAGNLFFHMQSRYRAKTHAFACRRAALGEGGPPVDALANLITVRRHRCGGRIVAAYKAYENAMQGVDRFSLLCMKFVGNSRIHRNGPLKLS